MNTVTGKAFHRIRVRTIAAIELDVADTGLERSPAPGDIVTGTFFLTGSLGPQETAVKQRGWFKR